MIETFTIELIKFAAHKKLNYSDYDSTNIWENTNCYSHAIGSTVTSNPEAYRIGVMSGNREERKCSSVEELKKFFLDDMKVLDLGVEEVKISKKEVIKNEEVLLGENQHLVVLFAQQRRKEDPINEFHFFRYDKECGWTQKRWNCKPYNFDPSIGWLDYWPNIEVGIFRITR